MHDFGYDGQLLHGVFDDKKVAQGIVDKYNSSDQYRKGHNSLELRIVEVNSHERHWMK